MKVISVCNHKGGCAKTTSVVSIAAELVMQGKKVLIIDNDYQANLTSSIGIKPGQYSLVDCFKGDKTLKDIILNCPTLENLDIVPCNLDYSNVDIAFATVKNNKVMLRDLIAKEKLDYDFIIIDCSPSLNLTVINALVASDSIIIPMEPSLFNVQGLGNLIKIIKMIQNGLNSKLKIEGILLTRVDSRSKVVDEVRSELDELFGDKIFDTVIHQSTSVVRSQLEGLPICLYEPRNKVVKEYEEIVKEILKNG
nr:MAG: cellulose biosynthesis protein [Bacteriophage sp.]